MSFDYMNEKQLTWWAQSRIRNLKERIELLEQENKALKKEITLSKNLKNFMVDGFDIDNPYDYR